MDENGAIASNYRTLCVFLCQDCGIQRMCGASPVCSKSLCQLSSVHCSYPWKTDLLWLPAAQAAELCGPLYMLISVVIPLYQRQPSWAIINQPGVIIVACYSWLFPICKPVLPVATAWEMATTLCVKPGPWHWQAPMKCSWFVVDPTILAGHRIINKFSPLYINHSHFLRHY